MTLFDIPSWTQLIPIAVFLGAVFFLCFYSREEEGDDYSL